MINTMAMVIVTMKMTVAMVMLLAVDVAGDDDDDGDRDGCSNDETQATKSPSLGSLLPLPCLSKKGHVSDRDRGRIPAALL